MSIIRQGSHVELALFFPWEEVFAPIEQEYVQARFERYWHKRNQKSNHSQTDLFPHLPKDVNVQPKKSSKGRNGIDFMPYLNRFYWFPFSMWKLWLQVFISKLLETRIFEPFVVLHRFHPSKPLSVLIKL